MFGDDHHGDARPGPHGGHHAAPSEFSGVASTYQVNGDPYGAGYSVGGPASAAGARPGESPTGHGRQLAPARKYVAGDPSLEAVPMELPRPHDRGAAAASRAVRRPPPTGAYQHRSRSESGSTKSATAPTTEARADSSSGAGFIDLDTRRRSGVRNARAVWEGDVLWKIPFSKAGVPRRKFFQVVRAKERADDGAERLLLQWSDPARRSQKPRSLPLDSVVQIRKGHKTMAFEQQLHKRGAACVRDPRLCFSLVAKARTIDIAAMSMQQRDDWLEGLRNSVYSESRTVEIDDTPDKSDARHRYSPELEGTSDSSGAMPREDPYSTAGARGPRGMLARSLDSTGPYSADRDATGAEGGGVMPPEPQRPTIILPRPHHHGAAGGSNHVASIAAASFHADERDTEAPSSEDLKFWTATLFDHVRHNRLQDVAAALGSGCPVDLQEPSTGDTPLLIACRHGWLEITDLCLQRGARNDPHPHFGQTALQTAVLHRHSHVVDLILNTAATSGADAAIVNHADDTSSAALHIAASNGDAKCTGILLDHGANPTLVDGKGRTPLHVACARSTGDEGSGHYECAALLLEAGSDSVLNCGDHDGNTPLHVAASHGVVDIVRLLLQTAANPLYMNAAQKMPIELAVAGGHRACLELLREYEAEPTFQADGLRTTRCLREGEDIPDGYKPGLGDDSRSRRRSPVADAVKTFASPRGTLDTSADGEAFPLTASVDAAVRDSAVATPPQHAPPTASEAFGSSFVDSRGFGSGGDVSDAAAAALHVYGLQQASSSLSSAAAALDGAASWSTPAALYGSSNWNSSATTGVPAAGSGEGSIHSGDGEATGGLSASAVVGTAQTSDSTSEPAPHEAWGTEGSNRTPGEGSAFNAYSPGSGGDGAVVDRWEMHYTDDGRLYFVNLTTGLTQWEDPRVFGEVRTDDSEAVSGFVDGAMNSQEWSETGGSHAPSSERTAWAAAADETADATGYWNDAGQYVYSDGTVYDPTAPDGEQYFYSAWAASHGHYDGGASTGEVGRSAAGDGKEDAPGPARIDDADVSEAEDLGTPGTLPDRAFSSQQRPASVPRLPLHELRRADDKRARRGAGAAKEQSPAPLSPTGRKIAGTGILSRSPVTTARAGKSAEEDDEADTKGADGSPEARSDAGQSDDAKEVDGETLLSRYARMIKMGGDVSGPVRQRMARDGLSETEIDTLCGILARLGGIGDRASSADDAKSPEPARTPPRRKRSPVPRRSPVTSDRASPSSPQRPSSPAVDV